MREHEDKATSQTLSLCPRRFILTNGSNKYDCKTGPDPVLLPQFLMISEFQFPLLVKLFSDKESVLLGEHTPHYLPPSWQGFAAIRLFNKKACIVHKMNKDAMPSLQALDTMVKEKKVKIRVFLFLFGGGLMISSRKGDPSPFLLTPVRCSVHHKKGRRIGKCPRSSCHHTQMLWLTSAPTEAFRVSSPSCERNKALLMTWRTVGTSRRTSFCRSCIRTIRFSK